MAKGDIYVYKNNQWIKIDLQTTIDHVDGLGGKLGDFIEESAILENNKLKKDVIPTEILAGMTYGGVFSQNTSGGTTVSLSNAGKYLLGTTSDAITLTNAANSTTTNTYGYNACNGLFFIANTTSSFASLNIEKGDWIVAVASGWSKIDNTDAIKSVNGQVGDVYTYKGGYDSTIDYYRGDLVLYSNSLYICIIDKGATTRNTITNTANWQLVGIDYSGDITNINTSLNAMSATIAGLPKFYVKNSTEANPSGAQSGSILIKLQ